MTLQDDARGVNLLERFGGLATITRSRTRGFESREWRTESPDVGQIVTEVVSIIDIDLLSRETMNDMTSTDNLIFGRPARLKTREGGSAVLAFLGLINPGTGLFSTSVVGSTGRSIDWDIDRSRLPVFPDEVS